MTRRVDDMISRMRGEIVNTALASEDSTKEISKSEAIHEFSGRGLAIGAAQGLMSNEEELAQSLNRMRGVTTRRDLAGDFVADIDGETFALNKEGFSEADLTQLATRGAAYAGPQGRIAGMGAKKAAQVAAGAGASESVLQGIEWLLGGVFDPEDVATAAVMAPAAQIGIDKIGDTLTPKIVSASKKAKEYFKGGLGKVSAEAQPDYANKVKREIEDATKSENGASEVEGIIDTVLTGDPSKLAKALDLDEESLQAIREIGGEESLILSHISNNKSFRELEQAVGAKPSSQISSRQSDAISKGKSQADKSIVESGGLLDKAELSEEVKESVIGKIRGMEDEAKTLYGKGDEIIGEFSHIDVSAENTIQFIDKMLEKRKGRGKTINPKLMSAYKVLKGTPEEFTESIDPITNKKTFNVSSERQAPTYEELNSVRKKVGEGLSNMGEFKDAEKGVLKAMYGMLRQDQDKALSMIKSPKGEAAMGYIKRADEITTARKRMEKEAILLMGKDLSGDIMPKAGSAIKGLANKAGMAKIGKFQKFMASIPPQYREQVATSAVNDLFRGGAARDKELGLTSFSSIYNDLQRQPTAKKELFKHLPPQMQKRFDTVGKFSNSISRALEDRIKTGQINSLLDDLSSKGFLGKLFTESASKVADAAGAKFGVFGAGSAAMRFIESQTDQAKKIESLLSDQKFISDTIKAAEAMRKRSDGDFQSTVSQSKAKKIAETFKSTSKRIAKNVNFKKWLDSIPEDKREQILRTGFLSYMMTDENQEEK